jgi:hypothetical protein
MPKFIWPLAFLAVAMVAEQEELDLTEEEMPLLWKGLGASLSRSHQGLNFDRLGQADNISGSRHLSAENFDGTCAEGDPYCIVMTAYSDAKCINLLPGINQLSAPVAECDETCNGQCYINDGSSPDERSDTATMALDSGSAAFSQAYVKHGKYAMKSGCPTDMCEHNCVLDIPLQALPTPCLGPLQVGTGNLTVYAIFDGEIPLPGGVNILRIPLPTLAKPPALL